MSSVVSIIYVAFPYVYALSLPLSLTHTPNHTPIHSPTHTPTQVAQTDRAIPFWEGKLQKTKFASVMTLMLANFTPKHKIYCDTDDMGVVFW